MAVDRELQHGTAQTLRDDQGLELLVLSPYRISGCLKRHWSPTYICRVGIASDTKEQPLAKTMAGLGELYIARVRADVMGSLWAILHRQASGSRDKICWTVLRVM
jgi:hypothetical protein